MYLSTTLQISAPPWQFKGCDKPAQETLSTKAALSRGKFNGLFFPFHYDFFRIIFYNIASFPLLLISGKNSLLNLFRFKYKITFKLGLTLKIVKTLCLSVPSRER